MQRVENYNRRRTFKIAYSKMYQQLEGNTGFRKWAGGKGNLDQQIKTRARNYAIRMTNMLHFDYGDISKSKLLRHPLGRFVFQFQHYAQKFFELNKKACKEFWGIDGVHFSTQRNATKMLKRIVKSFK